LRETDSRRLPGFVKEVGYQPVGHLMPGAGSNFESRSHDWAAALPRASLLNVPLAPINHWNLGLAGEYAGQLRRCAEFLKDASMPNHHPSRSWRGCAMCKPHKRRGAGRAVKDPVAVVRKLGKRKRLSRRYLGDAT
jgi:hypothetical protein